MTRQAVIESKITRKMQDAFSNTKDRKAAVHVAAAAGAAIVAKLPVGTDVWALRLTETTMIILIAKSYGETITKSTAKGIMLSSTAQFIGEAVALSSLEAAEVAKLSNPVIAYAIKSSVAVGMIETIGHLAISYYEKPQSLSAKTCSVAETVGLAADISRITELASSLTTPAISENIELPVKDSHNPITFCGNFYTEQDLDDALKKLKRAQRDVEIYSKYLESDIRFGRNTSMNERRLDYANKEYASAFKLVSQIRSYLNRH